METILTISTDNMDDYNSEENEYTSIDEEKAEYDNIYDVKDEKQLNINELEEKVKHAMEKLKELIKNKQREEVSLKKLQEEVDIIKKDELE